MKNIFLLVCSLIFFCLPHIPFAQTQPADDPPAPDSAKIYEQPTMEKFSQMYWALGRMDLNNNLHIDNFLLINECDIYKDYYSNEFEWKGIRDAGRDYIEANKKSFPLRFEFVQPLFLGEYDLQEQRFEIQEAYKIDGVRRFEIVSSDLNQPICGISANIPEYPRGLVLELSRPFDLVSLPLSPEKAKEYILEKLEKFKKTGGSNIAGQPDVYGYRDAYMVMKVKMFSSQGGRYTADGVSMANVLGVLESIEIYADLDRKDLLYSENFRTRKTTRTAPERSPPPEPLP